MDLMEGIEIDIYRHDQPTTRATILNGRVSPKYLSELKGIGGGSFLISTLDPKILEDRSLIEPRNIVKVRINNNVIGAWLIQTKKPSFIGQGEYKESAIEVGGAGLKTWFDDTHVRPFGGLKRTSKKERFFNFASERGHWYDASKWITAITLGRVHKKDLVWGEARPDKWSEDAPYAQWIWAKDMAHMEEGTCYFRKEFTTSATRRYKLYLAGDDILTVFMDGEQIMTTQEGSSSFASTTTVDLTLTPGDHVLAMQCENLSGPGGVLAALTAVNQDDSETLVLQTGDAGWRALPYPEDPPGWNAGEIMLTLFREARDRGVRFPTIIDPQFTEDEDSNGNPWSVQLPLSFKIGESFASVIAKLEELGCDTWIDPETYKWYAITGERGFNLSQDLTFEDGSVRSAVVFEKGKNLRQANTEARGKIKNALVTLTDAGWIPTPQRDEPSTIKYGVVEGVLETGAPQPVARKVAQILLKQYATEEEGSTYDIFPTDKTPFDDFNEGDWVAAPNSRDSLVPRRVMSISVTETDQTGLPTYSVEFDTIFQDKESRISKILASIGGSGVGGASSNGGGGSAPGPIIANPSPTPPARFPKAPDGVVVTSEGAWTPNGVTPYARATVSWNAVLENTDGSPTDISSYEVWAHRDTVLDNNFIQYGQTTLTQITLEPFVPGENWVFVVVAKKAGDRGSAFSAEVTHTMNGPIAPMLAPSKPTLSSSKGVLLITWDGKLTNQEPPPQFRYVYALVSNAGANNFLRMGPTLARGGGSIVVSGLVIGQSYDVRLVAVDGVGIATSASEIATTTITGIALGDLDQSIDAAIKAAQAAAEAAAATTNLLLDPGVEENPLRYWTLKHANATVITSTPPRTGTRSLRVAATTSAFEALRYNNLIRVEEGERYVLSAWTKRTGSGGAVEGGIELSIVYGVTEASVSTLTAVAKSPEGLTTTFTQFSGVWTVPAGVKFMTPRVVCRDLTSGNVYLVDDFTLYRQVGNGLIVDGAVTAAKIGAGEVIAGKLSADSVAAMNIQAGAVIAGKIATDAVVANNIAAGQVQANHIAAGTIQTLHLTAEVGKELDISSNNSVNIIVEQVNTVAAGAHETADTVETMATYYQFGTDGAIISTPDSAFQLALRNDRIEMLEQGIPVSYWNAGQMFVRSFVGDEVILGNHKIEKYGDGTVVRAI